MPYNIAMPDILLRYSGVFAILIAWLFLVVPVVVTKSDFGRETVTTVAGKSPLLRFIITFGLMGGGGYAGRLSFLHIAKICITKMESR
jgi:hypothetical protein